MQSCAVLKQEDREGEVSIPFPIMSGTAKCNYVLPVKLENGER